jgi:hypothetical protein
LRAAIRSFAASSLHDPSMTMQIPRLEAALTDTLTESLGGILGIFYKSSPLFWRVSESINSFQSYQGILREELRATSDVSYIHELHDDLRCRLHSDGFARTEREVARGKVSRKNLCVLGNCEILNPLIKSIRVIQRSRGPPLFICRLG